MTMQRVPIDSATVKIECQHGTLQRFREWLALQNGHSAMRVTTPRLRRLFWS